MRRWCCLPRPEREPSAAGCVSSCRGADDEVGDPAKSSVRVGRHFGQSADGLLGPRASTGPSTHVAIAPVMAV